MAGQGLRRLADDDRPQPHRRPLQVRPGPDGVDHRGHEPARRRHREHRGRRAGGPHPRGAARRPAAALRRAARLPGDEVPAGPQHRRDRCRPRAQRRRRQAAPAARGAQPRQARPRGPAVNATRVGDDAVTSAARLSLGVSSGATDQWAPETPGRTA
ncbi:hypothetical protein NOCARDAX2BIS_480021 [Nocardioides sp. AX2bis]|nr:hypothetical protein NOCARDAX2BIS_480021 [Nocardioides sp. AX2bis]